MSCFSITIPLIKRFSLCVLLLVSLKLSDGRPQVKASSHFIQVHIDSLHPQENLTCKHSPTGKRQGASLEVVHRHGPCSKLKSSHSDLSLLQLDQDRADSIHARLAGDKVELDSSSANLPTRSGASVGSGNYIVSVRLGTPPKKLSLVFDTGSIFTWTQCQPCSLGSCYSQVDPIFDPGYSSSYTTIPCDSPLCTGLVESTGVFHGCFSSTCLYRTQYADGLTTVGFLAKERLTITSSDFIDGFVFGCGENNFQFSSSGFAAAGFIGLGRDSLSLVSQAAATYGNYFSYCLPPTRSTSTGHLTFGRGGTTARSFIYTPLLPNSGIFYLVDLQFISVAGQQIPISPFKGTIVDSGAVISRIPQQAYSALRAIFKQHMSKYPSVPSSGILDTCFDFSNYATISVPVVKLHFAGGGALALPFDAIMYTLSASLPSTKCLAFATITADLHGIGILGSVQQQGFDMVFDVDGGRIGFGPNAC